MTARQILELAKKKIATPAMWGKGTRQYRGIHTCCLAEAVEEVPGDWKDRKKAFNALKNALGIDGDTVKLVEWNDEPERTHDEVIKALSLAIKLAT